ncbi:MAG: hypothetical protein QHH12_07985 [Candidatus Bathyarchaeota archaeon]|nr:hypothetical protein [Candidatus Bathyarchaeota archaeon A05DMB-3]MDH7607675.1 hypothetical protein [Candidatus Bathyarchaeota archaeon]
MAELEGKCPRCGKTHLMRSPKDSVTCDCWQQCPICGAEMAPYTPDTAPKTYALNSLRELQVLTACFRHHPPLF